MFSNMDIFMFDYIYMYVFMCILFHFGYSLQESLETFVSWCGGLAFLQTIVNRNNFFVNVNIFPNVKTDSSYIYYIYYFGYSSGFLKANLANIMYIVKFKLFGVDIWKYCVHLLIFAKC